MKALHVLGLLGVVAVIGIGGLAVSGKLPVSVQFLPPAKPAVQESSSLPARQVPKLSSDEQGLGTPEAFIAAIYVHYEHHPVEGAPSFDPAFDQAPSYFDPDMLALMAEDKRLTPDGSVGALDWDPFCGCQDVVSFKTTVKTTSLSANHAKVVATIVNMDFPEPRPSGNENFDLVRIAGKWRIHDMGDPHVPSLRQIFINSNKSQAAYAASSHAP